MPELSISQSQAARLEHLCSNQDKADLSLMDELTIRMQHTYSQISRESEKKNKELHPEHMKKLKDSHKITAAQWGALAAQIVGAAAPLASGYSQIAAQVGGGILGQGGQATGTLLSQQRQGASSAANMDLELHKTHQNGHQKTHEDSDRTTDRLMQEKAARDQRTIDAARAMMASTAA